MPTLDNYQITNILAYNPLLRSNPVSHVLIYCYASRQRWSTLMKVQKTHADWPFHNWEALKSVARRFCTTQNLSISWFRGTRIVKCPVGCSRSIYLFVRPMLFPRKSWNSCSFESSQWLTWWFEWKKHWLTWKRDFHYVYQRFRFFVPECTTENRGFFKYPAIYTKIKVLGCISQMNHPCVIDPFVQDCSSVREYPFWSHSFLGVFPHGKATFLYIPIEPYIIYIYNWEPDEPFPNFRASKSVNLM